ncbi:ultraviolet-B receptor UVR8 isoform X2 [Durio zibethinus]|uniref:Ultraviolet-B receptor UVR8 isoform X2 n=1 Tax=Durio zibethinus TaxID=66656 RepID=A0A6P5Y058_DURZI|nr:ultraviolet-B receptor UVR8 isoform X2 [Durio zibethinus]
MALKVNQKNKETIVEQKQEGNEQQREKEEERLWSWGAGTDGQLGTARLEDEHLPQLLNVPSLSSSGPVSMLACGGSHVVALTSGGKVLTWGRGNSGQLGHGEMVNSLLTPKPVLSLESSFITQVSAGWNHSGFVSDEGCVFTCGDGSFGQLGHGDYRSHCSPVKVSFFDNKHVEQIACGMRHSLVLLKDSSGNQLFGFGSGRRGQLGISIDRIKSVNTPQVTCGFEVVKIISISANGDHSAALSADGQLYTWGRSFGANSDFLSPQHLPSPLQFSKAVLGWNHALVLSDDGQVFMLGGSHHGVLSNPEKVTPSKHLSGSPVLERVPGLDGMKIVQIAAGAEHSAVITEDGVIKTWGWGEHGQLGLGSTCDQSSPQTVNLSHEVLHKDYTIRVYCGSGFTYAIRTLSSLS